MGYLYGNCVLPNKTYAALRAVWREARNLLGASTDSPVKNAGQPEISEIPSGHEDYLAEVKASPRFDQTVQTWRWDFKLVELRPLLAYQFHVETVRAQALQEEAGKSHDMEALLRLCLPTKVNEIQPGAGCDVKEDPGNSEWSGAITFESDDLNMRILRAGRQGMGLNKLYWAGAGLGEGSRLFQVGRVGGRCYLVNGYHRAYQMILAGVTHAPCILLDLNHIGETGVRDDGRTFRRKLLESANPPVCAHFEKAYAVTLRPPKKTIRITWRQDYRPA